MWNMEKRDEETRLMDWTRCREGKLDGRGRDQRFLRGLYPHVRQRTLVTWHGEYCTACCMGEGVQEKGAGSVWGEDAQLEARNKASTPFPHEGSCQPWVLVSPAEVKEQGA